MCFWVLLVTALNTWLSNVPQTSPWSFFCHGSPLTTSPISPQVWLQHLKHCWSFAAWTGSKFSSTPSPWHGVHSRDPHGHIHTGHVWPHLGPQPTSTIPLLPQGLQVE